MSELPEKVNEFLDAIESHFVRPAMSDGVAMSCTATSVLLFCAADSLGGLFHSDDNANNRDRLGWTFERMGQAYSVRIDELICLRNALVHEARFDAYLSRMDSRESDHLSLTDDGVLLLSTRAFTTDFQQMLMDLRWEIACWNELTCRADARLEWAFEYVQEKSDTTPPPRYQLKRVKRKGK